MACHTLLDDLTISDTEICSANISRIILTTFKQAHYYPGWQLALDNYKTQKLHELWKGIALSFPLNLLAIPLTLIVFFTIIHKQPLGLVELTDGTMLVVNLKNRSKKYIHAVTSNASDKRISLHSDIVILDFVPGPIVFLALFAQLIVIATWYYMLTMT